MKRNAFGLVVAFGLVLAATLAATAADSLDRRQKSHTLKHRSASLGTSRQALLVVTDDWTATAGTLQRFERAKTAARWHAVGPPVGVVVGRSGLAWGVGAAGDDAAGGPIKKEGDGKAVAGVFHLGTSFGQSRDTPAGLGLPYLYLADGVECVDDSRSSHYNELVTKRQIGRADWASSEKMWAEPLYKRGVVVEYNTDHPQPFAGSCIFLHIWKGPDSVTAGCTAMAEPDLTRIIEWLDATKKPVLIQLPRKQYERLKVKWQLP